ncbi:MAG: NAD(P)/FAD-dependent oxidoreductase [Pseudomonadota bacterium]
MKEKTYDIIVIGAGPAGIMAAIAASSKGAKVCILEKNDRPGRKLLITGKGRCNITNASFDNKELVQVYGKSGKFLFPALNAFSVQDTIEFFERKGLKTKIERGNRVFPESDRSQDVLKTLLEVLRKKKVEIRTKSLVKSFKLKENKILELGTNKEVLRAKNFILATGGMSYPATGSSGDGYRLLEKLEHSIVKPRPALVPVLCKEKWIGELEGLSLKNVEISVYQNKKKKDSRFGEALFTDSGLSGPIVLDLSKTVGEVLEAGDCELSIDFKPALELEKLDKRMQRDFQEFKAKQFKNCLNKLLPQRLIPIMIQLTCIDENKKVSEISKKERKKLLNLLKDLRLNVKALDGFDKAIITSGGLNLKEVDPKTMRSKRIDNLFLAGEILDLDGPTGGYNLQIAWSTGYLAGKTAADTK